MRPRLDVCILKRGCLSLAAKLLKRISPYDQIISSIPASKRIVISAIHKRMDNLYSQERFDHEKFGLYLKLLRQVNNESITQPEIGQ